MSRAVIASICLAAALAGCATGRGRSEPEFVGRELSVESRAGQVSTLRFRSDGHVTARFGERETQGSWTLENRRLCFTWAGNFRECWPHEAPFRRGRTATITSDRGNVVQVTMR